MKLLFLNVRALQILKIVEWCVILIFFLQNRAARVRVGKGDKPVTYEQAHPPHYIGERKGWLSQHTSELLLTKWFIDFIWFRATQLRGFNWKNKIKSLFKVRNYFILSSRDSSFNIGGFWIIHWTFFLQAISKEREEQLNASLRTCSFGGLCSGPSTVAWPMRLWSKDGATFSLCALWCCRRCSPPSFTSL